MSHSPRFAALVAACTLVVAGAAAADDGGVAACPASDHNCFTTGGAGCTQINCCNTVCNVDAFCCATSWDSLCVNEANTMCTNCPSSDHNCFSTGGPGCSDYNCCLAVCDVDSFCCTTSWDSICAGEGSTMCDGCGDPQAGTCCASHGNPYCDNRTCCNLVCAIDGFCCSTSWDSLCVGEAADFPECGCACGKVDFGVTRDDFGNTNPCTNGTTPLNTQYVNRRSIVFGAATDLGTPPAEITSDGACDPSCRSAGDPPYSTDWWCQFRLPAGPGTPGGPAGVTTFSANICFIDGPVGELVMQGFDQYGNLVAQGFTTGTGSQNIGITAPSGGVISYVQVFASNPSRGGGLSVDCLNYDTPFAVFVCPDSDHSCFTTGGPGCTNTDCCEVVCSQDSFCCSISWDSVCKNEANSLCGDCGSPDAGSCFCPHTNFGCNNSGCCRTVCQVDSFCCQVSWDSICANEAKAMCGCKLDFNNDGVVNGADLGLLLAAWSTNQCPYDVNGDGIVNGADLGLLLAAWGPCS